MSLSAEQTSSTSIAIDEQTFARIRQHLTLVAAANDAVGALNGPFDPDQYYKDGKFDVSGAFYDKAWPGHDLSPHHQQIIADIISQGTGETLHPQDVYNPLTGSGDSLSLKPAAPKVPALAAAISEADGPFAPSKDGTYRLVVENMGQGESPTPGIDLYNVKLHLIAPDGTSRIYTAKSGGYRDPTADDARLPGLDGRVWQPDSGSLKDGVVSEFAIRDKSDLSGGPVAGTYKYNPFEYGKGHGYFIPLQSTAEMDRAGYGLDPNIAHPAKDYPKGYPTAFGIHPDGGPNGGNDGSQGCISLNITPHKDGVSDAEAFMHAWNAIPGGEKPDALEVAAPGVHPGTFKAAAVEPAKEASFQGLLANANLGGLSGAVAYSEPAKPSDTLDAVTATLASTGITAHADSGMVGPTTVGAGINRVDVRGV